MKIKSCILSLVVLCLGLVFTLPIYANADNTQGLEIAELMIKNSATVQDEDGDFSDYIELVNSSEKALSAEGWRISDNHGEGWALPALTLSPGERLLLFASGKDRVEGELHTDFKLSAGETLRLISPDGSLSEAVDLPKLTADTALIREGGDFVTSRYPSPGYADYDTWQDNKLSVGPLVINEVVVSNIFGSYESYVGTNDWLEIANISDAPVLLSDYYLSDNKDELKAYRLPELSLNPGGVYLFLCCEEGTTYKPNTGFKLNDYEERLYLSNDTEVIDAVFLRDIPLNGSYGRMDGKNGMFFFTNPSPRVSNRSDGARRLSSMPEAVTEQGIYEGIDGIDVELRGEGTIYYTTDGSLPTESSAVYTGPIRLETTGVIRAVAKQEGLLMSQTLSLSYIINEGHSLPVLSLVTDDPARISRHLRSDSKGSELPGSITLFEPEGGFSIGCGVSTAGNASLVLPKKNLKVKFRGVYGQESLNYELFDNTDITEFFSLSLRSGQDAHRLIFRQEVWQDLAIEMGSKVLSQCSKFCVLYLNGEYYGIVALKEDVSRQFYASYREVSKSSVETVTVPMNMHPEFYSDVIEYCIRNDLSDSACYDELCSRLDIESFIDWMILEGCCANTDLVVNYRFYRSSELDGKWQAVLIDIDHCMVDDYFRDLNFDSYKTPDLFAFGGIMGNNFLSSDKMTNIVRALLKNDSFRACLLERFAELYDTTLSNERILERIDYYYSLLEPEAERDWERWDADIEDWYSYVELLRKVIIDNDWQNYCKECLLTYMEATPEEIETYFG